MVMVVVMVMVMVMKFFLDDDDVSDFAHYLYHDKMLHV